MANMEISPALGGSRSTGPGDIDWLIIMSVSVAGLGLLVLMAIAVSNWRADQALKQARKNWNASSEGARRRLAAESLVKRNPLRREK